MRLYSRATEGVYRRVRIMGVELSHTSYLNGSVSWNNARVKLVQNIRQIYHIRTNALFNVWVIISLIRKVSSDFESTSSEKLNQLCALP